MPKLVEQFRGRSTVTAGMKPKTFANGHVGEAVPKPAARKRGDSMDQVRRHDNRRGGDGMNKTRRSEVVLSRKLRSTPATVAIAMTPQNGCHMALKGTPRFDNRNYRKRPQSHKQRGRERDGQVDLVAHEQAREAVCGKKTDDNERKIQQRYFSRSGPRNHLRNANSVKPRPHFKSDGFQRHIAHQGMKRGTLLCFDMPIADDFDGTASQYTPVLTRVGERSTDENGLVWSSTMAV